jgi:hypothetical protein
LILGSGNCRFLGFPGFPVELGGSGELMRLSSLKGARADLSSAAILAIAEIE